jgi:hypothetical protein
MPKEFSINDAICGGNDSFYNEYFGGYPLNFNSDQMEWAILCLTIALVIVIIMVYPIVYPKKSTFSEHATNSNASVALVEFSAGAVGGNTSAPMDLYGSSVYARNLQDVSQFSYNDIDPSAKPGDPKSAAWYVLNSDIMGCAKPDNANNPWNWLALENRKIVGSVANNPAVVAAKQAVLAANPAAISNNAEVVAVKQAVIAADPSLAKQPVAVELHPAVIAAKDQVLNTSPQVVEVAKSVLTQASNNVAKESFSPNDQCPTVGKRMGDEPLTKSLMGY